MNHPDLSVVIPVYRGGATLPELLRRLLAVLERGDPPYEVVLVDDGSPDDSWRTLAELQAQHPHHVVAIELMRNFGQHNALMCGLRHARGRLVVTMDDDLQHQPEDIPRLLQELESGGHDVVYGVPQRRRQHRLRNAGSALIAKIYQFAFKTKVRPSAFRVLRREVVDAILTYALNFTFVDGLLAWNTGRIGEVTVEHKPRAHGRSGYSLVRLISLALNLFTNFSLVPLQIASIVGILVALAGFGAGGYFLLLYCFGGISVAGYASTIVAVLILGGLQLLSLGIIGEYLGRLHINVNRKPQYTVRQVLEVHPQNDQPDHKSAEKGVVPTSLGRPREFGAD